MEEKSLYTIGELSAICGIPISTLRYYDKIDILTPTIVDESTNYRYYSNKQIFQAFLIKHMKELHFSLSSIKSILDIDNIEYLKKQIENQLLNLSNEVKKLNWAYTNGQLLLKRLTQNDDFLNMFVWSNATSEFRYSEPKIDTIPQQNIIFIRQKIEQYKNEEAQLNLWGKLFNKLKSENMVAAGSLFVNYYLNPLEQFYSNYCDYELGIPISDANSDANIDGKKYFRSDEAFTAVIIYYTGSYSHLIHPYIMAMQWITKNNLRISGPMRDVFLISPIHTLDQKNFLTKIIIPIDKYM